MPKNRNFAQKIVLVPINAWRSTRDFRKPCCRYFPSCADYAVEAVDSHGALRGSWLAFRRVLRCNPFGSHGIDLVPPVDNSGESVGNVERAAA